MATEAKVTITWPVPLGYQPGDTVKLFGDGGAGTVNYDTPLDKAIYPVYPNGNGILGFGLAPFARHRFGQAFASGVVGFGAVPFGKGPFGLGTHVLQVSTRVTTYGTYQFALGAFDAAGNAHDGSPEEVSVEIDIQPAAPTGMKMVSYDPTSQTVTLEALT